MHCLKEDESGCEEDMISAGSGMRLVGMRLFYRRGKIGRYFENMRLVKSKLQKLQGRDNDHAPVTAIHTSVGKCVHKVH